MCRCPVLTYSSAIARCYIHNLKNLKELHKMFRKTLTIVAIGISVLAMGTVKSNAQCALHFGAVVGASVSTAQGTVDYTIHDWIGIDCVHYIMITYVNEK